MEPDEEVRGQHVDHKVSAWERRGAVGLGGCWCSLTCPSAPPPPPIFSLATAAGRGAAGAGGGDRAAPGSGNLLLEDAWSLGGNILLGWGRVASAPPTTPMELSTPGGGDGTAPS